MNNLLVLPLPILRDIDERQLQKVCSEVADWLLRSQPGDYCDLNSIKDLQPALVLKELRNRFDSVWTHQVENKVKYYFNKKK
jgi:hypothetical protein